MALATVSDVTLRVHELFWYIERTTGKRIVDKNQAGTVVLTPFIEELVRVSIPASSGAETTSLADYATLAGTYWTYRKARLDAGL